MYLHRLGANNFKLLQTLTAKPVQLIAPIFDQKTNSHMLNKPLQACSRNHPFLREFSGRTFLPQMFQNKQSSC